MSPLFWRLAKFRWGGQRAKKKKKRKLGAVWSGWRISLLGQTRTDLNREPSQKPPRYLDLELDFLGHSANSRTFELWKGGRNRRHISEFRALSTILAWYQWSDRPPHKEQLRVKAFIRTNLPIENSHRHCCLRHFVDPPAGHTSHPQPAWGRDAYICRPLTV